MDTVMDTDMDTDMDMDMEPHKTTPLILKTNT